MYCRKVPRFRPVLTLPDDDDHADGQETCARGAIFYFLCVAPALTVPSELVTPESQIQLSGASTAQGLTTRFALSTSLVRWCARAAGEPA